MIPTIADRPAAAPAGPKRCPTRLLAAAVACLLLAGCAVPQDLQQDLGRLFSAGGSEARDSDAQRVAALPSPAAADDRTAILAPVPTVPPKRKEVPPVSVLKGMTDFELVDLLGEPSFRRIDKPATLLQYRGDGCILDLFLYADGPVSRVTHYDFRPDPAAGPVPDTTVPVRHCFSSLISASPAGGKS